MIGFTLVEKVHRTKGRDLCDIVLVFLHCQEFTRPLNRKANDTVDEKLRQSMHASVYGYGHVGSIINVLDEHRHDAQHGKPGHLNCCTTASLSTALKKTTVFVETLGECVCSHTGCTGYDTIRAKIIATRRRYVLLVTHSDHPCTVLLKKKLLEDTTFAGRIKEYEHRHIDAEPLLPTDLQAIQTKMSLGAPRNESLGLGTFNNPITMSKGKYLSSLRVPSATVASISWSDGANHAMALLLYTTTHVLVDANKELPLVMLDHRDHVGKVYDDFIEHKEIYITGGMHEPSLVYDGYWPHAGNSHHKWISARCYANKMIQSFLEHLISPHKLSLVRRKDTTLPEMTRLMLQRIDHG